METSPYKFSCVFLKMPPIIALQVKSIFDRISPSHIIEKSSEPHITLLYGLHAIDSDAIRVDCSPLRLKFGALSLFETDSADVLKIDIESEDCHKINNYLRANYEYTSDFPDYKPHLTIAYIQRGFGSRYTKLANSLQNTTVTIQRPSIVFADPDGNQTLV